MPVAHTLAQRKIFFWGYFGHCRWDKCLGYSIILLIEQRKYLQPSEEYADRPILQCGCTEVMVVAVPQYTLRVVE
ncbi:unnamed protein product [Heligmosomoides polygyrus]|uniref:TGF_BETA_2 domain-containing protein n=1 Tax=Heligmosomoides polygyrus TaxID=6339 RepID=A0A183FCL3_HELPZ|nr:unnamed protein product [Heligmosomoides polygyrus]